MTPLVSIGLPVFNAAPRLNTVLQALLGQTHGDLELIVSDNASTDATGDICLEVAARDQRVRYERMERNIGPIANFNRVAARARGRYFMWAAHDDHWHSTYVARCLQILRDHRVAIAATRAQILGAGDEVVAVDEGFSTLGLSPASRFRRYKRAIHDGRHYGAVFYGLMRHDILTRALPMPNMIAGDHVVIARVSLLGGIHTIQETLFFKRWGGSSVSFEKQSEVLGLTDRRVVATPMFWREIALQRVIAESTMLSRPEKLMLRGWSWANFVRRHGCAEFRSRMRVALERHPRLLGALRRLARLSADHRIDHA